MSAASGATSFDGIVPKGALAGAVVLVFLATLDVFAAIFLTIVFGVALSMSLLNGWSEYYDLALWSAAVLASIGLYLPGSARRMAAMLLVVALPAALLCLVQKQHAEGALLFFAALLLHGSIMLARTLGEQAAQLSSPRRWIERRLLARRCPRCLYDLRYLPNDQCPECGFAFGTKETLTKPHGQE